MDRHWHSMPMDKSRLKKQITLDKTEANLYEEVGLLHTSFKRNKDDSEKEI